LNPGTCNSRFEFNLVLKAQPISCLLIQECLNPWACNSRFKSGLVLKPQPSHLFIYTYIYVYEYNHLFIYTHVNFYGIYWKKHLGIPKRKQEFVFLQLVLTKKTLSYFFFSSPWLFQQNTVFHKIYRANTK
jgi:hypothetical protein